MPTNRDLADLIEKKHEDLDEIMREIRRSTMSDLNNEELFTAPQHFASYGQLLCMNPTANVAMQDLSGWGQVLADANEKARRAWQQQNVAPSILAPPMPPDRPCRGCGATEMSRFGKCAYCRRQRS